jgi:hypothetical protein
MNGSNVIEVYMARNQHVSFSGTDSPQFVMSNMAIVDILEKVLTQLL